KTTSRATVHTPLGFGTVTRLRTGLAGRGFWAEGDSHARCLCLVGDVLALAAMRPQPDFLLAIGVQAFAIGYVSHIANDQGRDAALLGPRDHCPAGLMLHVPRPLLLLGENAHLAPLQALPRTRAVPLPVLLGPQFREPLLGILRIGSQRPASANDGFF